MDNVNKLSFLNKIAATTAIFILMGHFEFAIAGSQPSCQELSNRNPASVILCKGQRWYGGKVLSDQSSESSSLSGQRFRHIQQQNPASMPKNTSASAGMLALLILFLVVIFIIALSHQNRQSKKTSISRSLEPPEIKIQISTGGYSFADRKPSVPPDSVWVPQGKLTKVAGYTIPGGLIYVGTGLRNIQGWGVEPALIDPSLPIDKNSSDRQGVNMTYWPSYSQINPASRTAFLQWLADGCKDPGINIGYVFLYFYGLERRALSDAETSPIAQQEAGTILNEVKRLRSIYSGASFLNYTSGFINVIESKLSKEKLYRNPPSFETGGYELPFGLKKGLAQLAADGVPLPADWALAWVANDPENKLRTPAYRCEDEFQKLFHIRYTEKFPQGMIIPQKGYKLRGTYRPANASFNQAVVWNEEGLLDVTAHRSSIKQLFKIAEDCVEELDPYSRYLGRSGGAPSPLAKLALFPAPLLRDCQDQELQILNRWLSENVSSDNFFATDMKSIADHFSLFKSENFDKRDFVALCQLLTKMGVGIEPDVRFGSLLPESGHVVLFTLPKDSANAPSLEYTSATAILQLATAVAGSDEQVSETEEKHLEEQLEVRFKLGAEEKIRLRAHMHWLLRSSPSFSGVKKRLESFNQTQREVLGRFLVSIAQLDGYIDPGEIKTLDKIYGLLGLDSKSLYSHVHTAATEPVKIEDEETQTPVFALPKAPRKKKPVSVDLDMSKIDAKLADTAAVAAMLGSIFVEDKPEVFVAKETQSEVTGNLKYFESEHHGFIKELLQKLSWTRKDLEALAAKSNLLLDGVLDSINEASFKAFDQPFFEGEDPIEINSNVLKELQI